MVVGVVDGKVGRTVLRRVVASLAMPLTIVLSCLAVVGLQGLAAHERRAFLARGEQQARLIEAAWASLPPEQLRAGVTSLVADPNDELVDAEVAEGEAERAFTSSPGELTATIPLGAHHLRARFVARRDSSIPVGWFLVAAAVILSTLAFFVSVLLAQQLAGVFAHLVTPILSRRDALRAKVMDLFRRAEAQSAAARTHAEELQLMMETLDRTSRSAEDAARRSQVLVETSSKSEHQSREALEAVLAANGSLQELQAEAGSLAARLGGLRDRAKEASEVISRVQVIAERSNLLALNASMEAARGDGRGFIIVSRQMRQLSESARESALQARSLMADVERALAQSLEDAENGSLAVDSASKFMDRAATRLSGFSIVSSQLGILAEEIVFRGTTQKASAEEISTAAAAAHQAWEEQENASRALEENASQLKALSSSLLELAETKVLSTSEPASEESLTQLRPVVRRASAQAIGAFALSLLVVGLVLAKGILASPAAALEREAPLMARTLGHLLPKVDVAGQRALLTAAIADGRLQSAVVRSGDGAVLARADSPRQQRYHELDTSEALPDGRRLTLHFGLGLGEAWTGELLTPLYLALAVIWTLAAFFVHRGARAGAQHVSQLVAAVRSATSELSTLVSKLATTSTVQAESAESVATKMLSAREVAAKLLEETQRASDTTQALVEQRRGAQAEAFAVTHAIVEARRSMQQVNLHISSTADAVARLAEKTAQVGAIAQNVGGVAVRSHFLALNAALEASRARDEGRGFSVVAQEMGVLSDASKAAAAEVGALLGQILSEISETRTGAQRGGEVATVADSHAERAVTSIDGFSQTMLGFVEGVSELSVSSTQQGAQLRELARVVEGARTTSQSQAHSARAVGEATQLLVALSSELVAISV